MKVAVITPTIGNQKLSDCLKSVDNQTYDNLTHYIFIDGQEHRQKVHALIEGATKVKTVELEENVGKGWYGHRVFAACSFLVNADIIVYLDEDNWFEPDHIPSMVKLLEEKNLDWCYSLRKIVDKEGNFLFNDDCDSLGEYPSWKYGHKFVDMNCYLFKNCVISQTAHVMFDLVRTYDGDKNLFKEVSNRYPNFAGTGKYTVNYRMTRPNQEDWYKEGNEVMNKRYSISFPWREE